MQHVLKSDINILLDLDGSLRLLNSPLLRIDALKLPVRVILAACASLQLFRAVLDPKDLKFGATAVDFDDSLGGLDGGGRFLGGNRLSDCFVDLSLLLDLRLFLAFNRLVLLEDLLRRGELVGRLRRRRARQVLGRVEATDRGDVGNVDQLEIIVLLAELADSVILREVTLLVDVAGTIVVPALVVATAVLQPKLLRRRRQSDALGQVRKGIDELALLFRAVVETAGVTELAGSGLGPVLARRGLIIGVNGAERSLAEVLGQGLNKN